MTATHHPGAEENSTVAILGQPLQRIVNNDELNVMFRSLSQANQLTKGVYFQQKCLQQCVLADWRLATSLA